MLNLSQYRVNVHSQFGEDGVIQKLLELTGITEGWLVEFGAWDGIYLSNTFHAYLQNKNFRRLLIEIDPNLFKMMERNIGYGKRNVLLNLKVEQYGKNNLNNIFHQYCGGDISVLSIDIDGGDLDVWDSLDKNKWRPAIVIIEETRWDSPSSLDELVRKFDGWNLVCCTGNFIFVREDYGIKSMHTVHELIKTSALVNYDTWAGKISKERADEIGGLAVGSQKEIYKILAGEQYITTTNKNK